MRSPPSPHFQGMVELEKFSPLFVGQEIDDGMHKLSSFSLGMKLELFKLLRLEPHSFRFEVKMFLSLKFK